MSLHRRFFRLLLALWPQITAVSCFAPAEPDGGVPAAICSEEPPGILRAGDTITAVLFPGASAGQAYCGDGEQATRGELTFAYETPETIAVDLTVRPSNLSSRGTLSASIGTCGQGGRSVVCGGGNSLQVDLQATLEPGSHRIVINGGELEEETLVEIALQTADALDHRACAQAMPVEPFQPVTVSPLGAGELPACAPPALQTQTTYYETSVPPRTALLLDVEASVDISHVALVGCDTDAPCSPSTDRLVYANHQDETVSVVVALTPAARVDVVFRPVALAENTSCAMAESVTLEGGQAVVEGEFAANPTSQTCGDALDLFSPFFFSVQVPPAATLLAQSSAGTLVAVHEAGCQAPCSSQTEPENARFENLSAETAVATFAVSRVFAERFTLSFSLQ